ncbi:hypothetical protein HY312_00450 [Candidatus Saccharibacteria bacterium]|nr:hypothetical protein [Candidatus Saccharibacteria bacterium]
MSGRSLKNKQSARNTASSPVKKFLLSKKAIVLIIVIALVIIGLLASSSKTSRQTTPVDTPASKNTSDATPSSSPSEAVPTYKTVTPNNKSIDELGGWQRVSPSNSNPVFAYSDKIGAVEINVSQQPLPESFENNTESHVADLAKKFNATTKLDAGATKAWIGTSAKGPQSVIFNANEHTHTHKVAKNNRQQGLDTVHHITQIK